jgi:MFS family permease
LYLVKASQKLVYYIHCKPFHLNNQTKHARPILMALLTLPYGIALGWAAGTLPVMLKQHGFFPVPATMIATLGLSLGAWLILPAPIVDSSFSLRRWYAIGLALSIFGILPFFWLPLHEESSGLLEVLIVVSQLGALLILLSAIGFMAKYVSADKIGRAAGWYQVGYTGGQGVGVLSIAMLSGGFSWKLVLVAEVFLMLIGLFALYRFPAGKVDKEPPIGVTAAQAFLDGRSWMRSRVGIFTCLMALSPIGIGAATVAWYSGSRLYGIGEKEIGFVIGPLGIVFTLAGFIAGGWAADRFGKWTTWLRSGGLLALTALSMAFCPFIHWLFDAGILCYAFFSSACAAAFWAIIVQAVGPRLAVTKITLLSMVIAIPLHYMRNFDGSIYDDYSIHVMLIGEAVICFLCIGIALVLKRRLRIHEGMSISASYP